MHIRILLLLSLALSLPALGAEAPGLSVWYAFDAPDDPGAGSGPDMWPAYGTDVQPGSGRFGGGLALPGRGGNGLYLPNPAAFLGEKAERGTIALWVRPEYDLTAGGQRVIIDFMRDCGNTLVDGYETVILADGDKLVARPALPVTLQAEGALARDRWTHVALAWDCTKGAALYVDGELKAQVTHGFEPTLLQADWPGRVGCHTPGGGYPFQGSIDELHLASTELSEAAALALLKEPAAWPTLEVTGDWRESVAVRNAGAAAVRFRLCTWQSGSATTPRWGYLPFAFAAAEPEDDYWLGGPITGVPAADAIEVAPGQTVQVTLPPATGPQWRRVGLLPEEGTRELAGRTFTGLRVKLDHLAPHVYAAGGPTRLGATVVNDTAVAFSGKLDAALLGAGDAPASVCSVPLALAPGEGAPVELHFEQLAVGAHVLRLTASEGDGPVLLDDLIVYGVPSGGLADICAAAATTTHGAEDEQGLRAMWEDGAQVVLANGKAGEYASAAKNIALRAAHGFRLWRPPAASYRDVCESPGRREQLKATARNLGRYLRDNPAVVMQSIAGEGLSSPPCYCDACNESFRAHLKARFDTLDALNEAWGSKYTDWGQVEQLGSAADIDDAAERLKMMKVALELPEANTARWKQLFELDRSRAIEWKRWHDGVLTRWYQDFATAFHSANGGQTPVGEQPCWANFKTHVLFSLAQTTDVGGMDLYLPGEGPTTLGYAAELFLNFDMTASAFHAQGKPIMVNELYVQDNSPALLPEAQGWWLLGRGYGLMTYFTYHYYYEGQRGGKPLIFGLFDKDGNPYPAHESFRRFCTDIKRFDSEYDYHSLRREEPRVALFLGDDVSLANDLETGGATWEAAGVHGHNGAYWLTERNGFAVELVNDATLATLDRETVLVVPWCHVVGPAALGTIAAFARGGGTVIVDGPLGLYDDCYRPYTHLPAGALGEELGLSFTEYRAEDNEVVLGEGKTVAGRGLAADVEMERGEVLYRDSQGRPAVVDIPLGKGHVTWLLTSLGPTSLSRNPSPDALALWASLLRRASLEPRWRLADRTPGQEASLLDVSFRVRGQRELFAFVTSFFGPTEGTLEIDLPQGQYVATDALSHEPAVLQQADGKWRVPLALVSEGTRVLRIEATDGDGFGAW